MRERHFLLLGFALFILAGCQSQSGYNAGKPATNWNPLAGWGQSRVPPPGTNQYGTSTLPQTQGFAVPPGTPFAPLPPGTQPHYGGAVAPGPTGYGAPPATVAPSTVPQASKPGSLGPAQVTPIRRASYEDPAAPAEAQSAGRAGPAPASQLTPY